MFGDIGHGTMMFIIGLILVLNRKNLSKNGFHAISVASFMVLLMGFFAMFCGYMYNDFMGISIEFTDTCFKQEGSEWIKKENCFNFFGIDAIWGRSHNDIA